MSNKVILLVLVLLAFVFFSPVFLHGKLPIPADALVGLYHPYRDFYSNEYPNGIPYKNFLITDPIRQQYPWKTLVINGIKQGTMPLWNPYAMAGYPLLGNFQSGAFYPFNLLLIFSLPTSWSVFIFLQPILAGIFLYLYLRNLGVMRTSSLFGAIVFSYSGFMMSWLEWGNIGHTALWLPLVLLSIDKTFFHFDMHDNLKFKMQSSKLQFKIKGYYLWIAVLIFSLVFSFFAGHLQTFFYVFILSFVYFITRWWQLGMKKKILFLFLISSLLFLLITAVQWVPTLRFIFLSARDVDVVSYTTPGWFIPWQHLIQFISPDFFGNPATLNYWGVWNYGEFLGYIGIPALIFSLYALLFRRDKKTLFLGVGVLITLLFAFPNPIASLPFQLQIPLLSTAQPTRLLFVIDFCLTVLAVLGIDMFLKKKDKKVFFPLGIVGLVFLLLWGSILLIPQFFPSMSGLTPVLIAKRNMILPSVVFLLSSLIIFAIVYLKKYKMLGIILFFALTFFDLYRVGVKFNAFSNKNFLYPSTKTMDFLMKQQRPFRIMTTDSRMLAPNVVLPYALETVDGYDPLYLRRYGELIAASERGQPDISPPFGFNRIITPHNYDSPIIDLLGVKYVLSLSDISSPKLKKVFQEGQTQVYENLMVFSRAFLVNQLIKASSKVDAMKKMFSNNLSDIAVVEADKIPQIQHNDSSSIAFAKESENDISFHVKSTGNEFMVVTNSYYPTWQASIVSNSSKRIPLRIFRTDYDFMGVSLPKGDYTVEFSQKIF